MGTLSYEMTGKVLQITARPATSHLTPVLQYRNDRALGGASIKDSPADIHVPLWCYK